MWPTTKDTHLHWSDSKIDSNLDVIVSKQLAKEQDQGVFLQFSNIKQVEENIKFKPRSNMIMILF